MKNPPPDGLCVYCGDEAVEWDHIPPRRLRKLMKIDDWKAIGCEAKRVPACRDCNSILGGKPLFTVGDRRAHVRAQFWKRHYRLIIGPGWRSDDYDELDGRLREFVENTQQRRRHILQRIGMLRGAA